MQIGSLVEYMGGQDKRDKFKFEKNIPYTVKRITIGNFTTGNALALEFEEVFNGYKYRKDMFREIQPPVTSKEILGVLKETVVLQD